MCMLWRDSCTASWTKTTPEQVRALAYCIPMMWHNSSCFVSKFWTAVKRSADAATGPGQAQLLRDLMAYYVSDQVQSNLSYFGLMPIPHTEVLTLPSCKNCVLFFSFAVSCLCKDGIMQQSTCYRDDPACMNVVAHRPQAAAARRDIAQMKVDRNGSTNGTIGAHPAAAAPSGELLPLPSQLATLSPGLLYTSC